MNEYLYFLYQLLNSVSKYNLNYKIMTRQNNLMLCELFHPLIHGFDENSDPNIFGHYIVLYTKNNDTSDSESEYDEHTTDDLDGLILNEEVIRIFKNRYRNLVKYITRFNINMEHKIIRNYVNIITKSNYITPHIGQRIYLSGNECVAIIKTMWIKLVQRCWKRVYKKRTQLISSILKNPQYLLKREHDPNWKIRIPSIHGMFWNSNA